MDDIYVYLMDIPGNGIREMTAPCEGGYTVYIDKTLPEHKILNAIHHAIDHILRDDWQRDSVQDIEREAHGQEYNNSLPLPEVFIRCPE